MLNAAASAIVAAARDVSMLKLFEFVGVTDSPNWVKFAQRRSENDEHLPID
jgi:hypothetical protein